MSHAFAAALLVATLAAAPMPARAQAWSPPARQMPEMPRMAELDGDWLTPRADWFRGLAPANLRPVGEPRGGAVARVVRYHDGPLPAVVWTDRNGDGRADLIEIFRAGSILAQLIDPEYDGGANVLRRYDASGALVSEERM